MASQPPTILSAESATWESKPRRRWSASQGLVLSGAAQFADNISNKRFSVPKKHQCPIQIVERIVDPRESRTHTTLDHHHRPRLVHIENRHSIDRTGRIVARRRIGDV